MLLVFLVRPSAGRAPFQIPSGLTAAPLGARCSALAIDLVPGAVLAVAVMKSPLSELARLPLWTTHLSETRAFFVMSGIMLAHVTLSELFTGTSIGKALMGLRVVAASGRRPNPGQVLVRSVIKALTLVIPVIAVLVLVNHNRQGLGDVLSKTVVVRTHQEDTDDAGDGS
jgi:uncharacterized RDD family membrane protein YckC